MFARPVRTALIMFAASAGLAGCANLGSYGGVSVGYGSPYGYGYDPYYYGSRYGYGYGYGGPYGYMPAYWGAHNSYYGWYGNYYYPGTGFYVYDRIGKRHRWSDAQRRYWQSRIAAIKDRRQVRENWSEFRRQRASATVVSDQPSQPRVLRERSLARQQANVERQQARQEAREARRSERQEARRARRIPDD